MCVCVCVCVFSPEDSVYQGMKGNCLSAISDVSAALWVATHSQATSTKPDGLLVDSQVLHHNVWPTWGLLSLSRDLSGSKAHTLDHVGQKKIAISYLYPY